jgi:hypothetical protein
VSGDPRIECSCDTVGWRGDLAKVASLRSLPELGLGRTWRANCRRFDPGGVPRPTSKIVATCPSPDGLARDGTQGGKLRLVLSYARVGALAVGGYKHSRGRESVCVSRFVSPSSRATTLSYEGPGPSFYRCKERVRVYNGGVAIC